MLKFFPPAAVLVLLLTTVPALAMPSPPGRSNSAIQCHCFQDRSLDPSQPEKVDPYLLATTQNSFLSTAFGVNKSQVVRKRMTGTSAEDLWMAFAMGQKTGNDPDALLSARRAEGSWEGAIRKALPSTRPLGPRIVAALESGSDRTLADAVADEALSEKLGVQETALNEMRTRGATTQEIVLASFLGKRAGRPAGEILREVKQRETSWGLVASNLGVEIGKMEREFERMMK